MHKELAIIYHHQPQCQNYQNYQNYLIDDSNNHIVEIFENKYVNNNKNNNIELPESGNSNSS